MKICPNCHTAYNHVVSSSCPNNECDHVTLLDIDYNMIPIIKELWSKGYSTKFSCEGHPEHGFDSANAYVALVVTDDVDLHDLLTAICRSVAYAGNLIEKADISIPMLQLSTWDSHVIVRQIWINNENQYFNKFSSLALMSHFAYALPHLKDTSSWTVAHPTECSDLAEKLKDDKTIGYLCSKGADENNMFLSIMVAMTDENGDTVEIPCYVTRAGIFPWSSSEGLIEPFSCPPENKFTYDMIRNIVRATYLTGTEDKPALTMLEIVAAAYAVEN